MPTSSRPTISGEAELRLYSAHAAHAFFARGVNDAGSLPDYPCSDDALLVWQAPPLEQDGHTRHERFAAMPPGNLALKQLEVLYLLGSLHYRPLGTCLGRDFPYPAPFSDPKVTGSEGPLVRFQAALVQVEVRIVARNVERQVTDPFLLLIKAPTGTNN